MKPIIPSDGSVLSKVVENIRLKRQKVLEETVYKADPDPFKYGIRVGYVKCLDEFLEELDRINRGYENDQG